MDRDTIGTILERAMDKDSDPFHGVAFLSAYAKTVDSDDIGNECDAVQLLHSVYTGEYQAFDIHAESLASDNPFEVHLALECIRLLNIRDEEKVRTFIRWIMGPAGLELDGGTESVLATMYTRNGHTLEAEKAKELLLYKLRGGDLEKVLAIMQMTFGSDGSNPELRPFIVDLYERSNITVRYLLASGLTVVEMLTVDYLPIVYDCLDIESDSRMIWAGIEILRDIPSFDLLASETFRLESILSGLILDDRLAMYIRRTVAMACAELKFAGAIGAVESLYHEDGLRNGASLRALTMLLSVQNINI